MLRRFGTVPSFLILLSAVALSYSAFAKEPVAHTPIPAPTQTPAPTPEPAGIFNHGPRNLKQLALTFDACSTHDNGFEPKIIETLKETHTPATLFLGGRWMEAHRDVVRSLARSKQFELASHAYSHPHMDKLTDTMIERQFRLAQKTFKALTGKRAKLFRPPFGDVNDSVVQIAEKNGLKTVKWDLPSGDPDPKLSLERIVRATSENARNGSIIVMHMNGRGIHTAEALPQLIEKLKARGFTFVTVGKLMKDSESATATTESK